MQVRTNPLFLIAMLLSFQTALAQGSDSVAAPQAQVEAAAVARSGVVDRLGQLQTEIVLLKAEAARAQARLALERAQAPLLSGNRNQEIASVTRVFGRDDNLSAEIRFSDGQARIVKTGDVLSDGYVVRHVAPSVVTLGKRNRQVQIPLAPVRAPMIPGVAQASISETPPLPDRAMQ